MEIVPEHLPGAAELAQWFGAWPSFHDAEILRLHLNRKGTSCLAVHTWAMTDEIDAKGHHVLTKHVVVSFYLEAVSGLQLDGFGQNVISGLTIRKTAGGYRIELGSCHGLAGYLQADAVRLAFRPGVPEESQSQFPTRFA